MTRHNHRNCFVTVHYERTQNKLRHMDLRWKRAGRETRKKRCEREKERRERENEFVESVWLLKRRRTVPRVARGPRSRYAHVIKRIKGTPRPSGSPVHPQKPGAQRYGEPWLTFRHSLRAPFIRHSFASTRITCTPARASSCVCAWADEIADQQTERARLIDYFANNPSQDHPSSLSRDPRNCASYRLIFNL